MTVLPESVLPGPGYNADDGYVVTPGNVPPTWEIATSDRVMDVALVAVSTFATV